MKRTFTVGLLIVGSLLLFALLVYAVLLLANVSVPASTTVHGLTPRRAWATASAGLALLGLLSGTVAHAAPAAAVGQRGHSGAVIALIAGLMAAASGALNLATASGGPGSGNGVVGGAAALVLGLAAVVLGASHLSRRRASGRSPS